MIYRITLTYQLSVSIHSCLCSSTLRQPCHNIAISYTCRTKTKKQKKKANAKSGRGNCLVLRHAGYGPLTRTKFNLPSVHISVIFTLITGIPSSSPYWSEMFFSPPWSFEFSVVRQYARTLKSSFLSKS